MNTNLLAAAAVVALAVAGCADMPRLGGGPKYGDSAGAVASQTDRDGTISALENLQVDENYKLGIGTAVGAVAGGLLGAQIGEGRGSTVGAVLGAAAGAAAGTVVESKMKKQDAQRVTVKMRTGGSVTIVQPVDPRLRHGMAVRVEGSGESARVVPR